MADKCSQELESTVHVAVDACSVSINKAVSISRTFTQITLTSESWFNFTFCTLVPLPFLIVFTTRIILISEDVYRSNHVSACLFFYSALFFINFHAFFIFVQDFHANPNKVAVRMGQSHVIGVPFSDTASFKCNDLYSLPTESVYK